MKPTDHQTRKQKKREEEDAPQLLSSYKLHYQRDSSPSWEDAFLMLGRLRTNANKTQQYPLKEKRNRREQQDNEKKKKDSKDKQRNNESEK